MSAHQYVITDSATMLRRNFRRMVRYPSVSLVVVGIPVILLLLFVYVFGGTLGAGLGVPSGGRAAYVDYVTPAIVLIAIAGAAQSTAISVAMDMHEGIITRFRTMGIARASVLVGHVLGSTIQTMAGSAALSTTFVSTVALDGGIRERLGSRRRFAAVTGTRSATRGTLVHNTAVVPVEVDPVDGTVTIEGRVLAVDPVSEVPISRRYLLA